MADLLRITIQFLQPLVHGRCDGDQPEWPPSPLRLFQALVAAAAGRFNERTQIETGVPALRWLEGLAPPEITACAGIASKVPTQFYVPDNSTDLLVPSWKRGETDKGPKRTEKVVLPTHLGGDTVYYLFRVANLDPSIFETLKSIARSITHLGWGIDMVAADADIISEDAAGQLPGQRWHAARSGGVALRVPKPGTLHDLMRKHNDFLNRLPQDGFRPVPPLREFAVRHYRRSTDPEPRPYCVFEILKPDASGRLSFNTACRTCDVAAWVRHAVSEACQNCGWQDFAQFVHGHTRDGQPNRGVDSYLRFSYLPLPTINSALNRVETIRRVLITAPPGFQERIDFIRRRLIGQELRWSGKCVGVLNALSGKDWVTDQYVGTSRIWSTVTPVILDGFDDHNPAKTQRLIRKALYHAGIPTPLEFEFERFGFRAGVERVTAFKRPEKFHGTMVHLQLTFENEVCGPMAIGAGRFRGFGLMARK